MTSLMREGLEAFEFVAGSENESFTLGMGHKGFGIVIDDSTIGFHKFDSIRAGFPRWVKCLI